MPAMPTQARGSHVQANAPSIDTAVANAPRAGDTAAGPMSLASPVAQGFKRTADGTVKRLGLGMDSVPGPTPHKRNKSMDTHSGTRIGEVCCVK